MKKSGVIDLVGMERKKNDSSDLIAEESVILEENYDLFSKLHDKYYNELPFPEIYEPGWLDISAGDYYFKAQMNEPYIRKYNAYNTLKKSSKPYVGKMYISDPRDKEELEGVDTIYFTDELLGVKDHPVDWIKGDEKRSVFININSHYASSYRQVYYDRGKTKSSYFDLDGIRLISILNREVKDVAESYGIGNADYDKIYDAFLKDVLKRNKNNASLKNTIMTIQGNQNEIIDSGYSRSFFVQGVAGSGKTMIMLHRIRRIIFSDATFNSGKFLILGPSQTYVNYISGVASEYGISLSNLTTVKRYYANVLGVKSDIDDTDETSLDEKFLKRVYSEEYAKEMYQSLADAVAITLSEVYEYLENKITSIESNDPYIERITSLYDNLERTEKESSVDLLKDYNELMETMGLDGIESINEIPSSYEKTRSAISDRKDELKRIEQDLLSLASSKPDSYNEEILREKEDIVRTLEYEISKSNNFMAIVKKARLKNAKKELESYKASYESKRVQYDRQLSELNEKKMSLESFDNGNLSLEDAEKKINDLYEKASSIFDDLRSLKEEIEIVSKKRTEYFKEKTEIEGWIEDLGSEKTLDILEKIAVACEELSELTNEQMNFIQRIRRYVHIDMNLTHKCFKERSEEAFNKAFIEELFIKKMKKDFEQICSDDIRKYKFYLFNLVYMQKLLGMVRQSTMTKLVMIDECQDLSQREIDMIRNLNPNAAFNLFGDTYQSVTPYGIKSWNYLSVDGFTGYYLLENFRNTNQIIKYCNDNLYPISMKPIGLDMDEVSVINLISKCELFDENIVIVKDDMSVLKVKNMLDSNHIQNYKIYTVVQSKGLEFYNVLVIDDGMTINEKYIAYSRALAKLQVLEI